MTQHRLVVQRQGRADLRRVQRLTVRCGEHREQARNGEIVVALVDDEATLKRFYREGEEIRLKPENSGMKALIYRERDAEVQILGKVTGLCRALG